MSKNIVWLSSYPKSGRTWLKILLESVLINNGGKVDMNDLKLTSGFAFNRTAFDSYFGVPSSDLYQTEINSLKRKYLFDTFKNTSEQKIILTHDLNEKLLEGHLFPEEITASSIQIVRNPLSIVASLANYLKLTIDESIDYVNGEYHAKRNRHFLSTTLVRKSESSWSEYVDSWANNGGYPTLVLRYEDLVQDPVHTATMLFDFLNHKIEPKIILDAIENCSFENLSKSERLIGFNEKPATAQTFFRKGSIDSWKDELNDSQIKKVMDVNSVMMKKFGYIV
jgi:hypothetical protein